MLTSRQNKKIKHLAALKQAKNRKKFQEFLVEGPHLLGMARASSYQILGIYATSEAFQPAYQAYPHELLSEELADYLSDTETTQGVFTHVKAPSNGLNLTLKEKQAIVLIDSVQDPGNLGTIIRTCDAFNFRQIILGPGTVDPFNEKVLRSAQGSHFNVQLLEENLNEAIRDLQQVGYHVVATALDEKATPLEHFAAHQHKPLAVIFGNEGQGVRPDLIEMANESLYITMSGRQESLNVAIAAAITLYELKD